MKQNLTTGSITKTMLLFALPMMVGNVLQQLYNVADTLIVGRILGANALAAVGAAYPLMVFLTSIFIGLCMGSGVVFSICFGKRDEDRMKVSIFLSFALIAAVALMALAAVFVGGASKGSVINTFAGTLIIGMINNGLNLIGVSPAWKNIILGLIIITAVVMDIMRSRKASRT